MYTLKDKLTLKKLLIKMKILLLVLIGLISNNCMAVDTYNTSNSSLNISTIIVNQTIYNNVTVLIESVISVGSIQSLGPQVTFIPSKNQLYLPYVNVQGNTYNNALVTIGKVISIGSSYASPVQLKSLNWNSNNWDLSIWN